MRSFDVATFVAFGAAQLGVAGNDVLLEFDYPEIYAPVDLGIGKCRLAVAEPAEMVGEDDPDRWSHIRVATKYPNITRAHFAARGVQAECIKLSGAMELAPTLGLSRRIVDLVVDRRHAQGQQPGRGRAYRGRDLAPGGQPHCLEDLSGGDRRLDRAVARRGRRDLSAMAPMTDEVHAAASSASIWKMPPRCASRRKRSRSGRSPSST